jgi:hypothetical protein
LKLNGCIFIKPTTYLMISIQNLIREQVIVMAFDSPKSWLETTCYGQLNKSLQDSYYLIFIAYLFRRRPDVFSGTDFFVRFKFIELFFMQLVDRNNYGMGGTIWLCPNSCAVVRIKIICNHLFEFIRIIQVNNYKDSNPCNLL